MARLPDYFEHLKTYEEGSPMYPLYYDETIQTFDWGGATMHVSDFDPYRLNKTKLGLDHMGMEIDRTVETPLILPDFGAVIVGPKLHDWARDNPDNIRSANRIMYEAYIVQLENPEEIPFDEEVDPGFMGFAANLKREGGLVLQVAGNCACLGPDPDSHKFSGTFEEGFAEYDLHNADSPVQRSSLFAGLGYLARLASGKPVAQPALF